MHVLLAGLKTMYSGVATPHQHQPTNVYLPPIRATNPGDASAQCRTAGSVTQSRTGAGHRAVRVAADAEYNLISSYHRENTSMPSSSLHLASGQRIWKRPHPRGALLRPPPQRKPFPLRNLGPRRIFGSLDQSESTSQTASRSVQPFLHSFWFCPAGKQT